MIKRERERARERERKEEKLIFHHECLIRGMEKWKGEKMALIFPCLLWEKDETNREESIRKTKILASYTLKETKILGIKRMRHELLKDITHSHFP
jgi:hypothetical protein